MLPDSPQVEKVVLAQDGVLEYTKPGVLHVDMSTIQPGNAIRVAEAAALKGVGALDAPVSGGEKGAARRSCCRGATWCGQAGPLGWEIPTAIGVKCAHPERDVVAVVGDYSFQFLMEEIAVAAQYRIPFVIVMINNEYLGLIRQAELGYEMNYAVDLQYGEGGIDHVKVMDAFGCPARRVERPEDIADALSWAALESEAAQLPVLVEVMVEREANAAMGLSLDNIVEYEPVPGLVPVAD